MVTFREYINTDIHPSMVKLSLHCLDTPDQHLQGLMHVKYLPENEGRLFVYPEQKPLSFWMKNCHIPLDLAFIDDNGILQELHELNPMDETRVKSNGQYRYAIEVNRGWFRKNNIQIGSRVLGEAMSDKQKEYMKKYQAKKSAEKRAARGTELEDEIRNSVFMTFKDSENAYTLDNLEGRIVDLQLRDGKSIRGIVQKPRDFVLDENALRIFDLDQFKIRLIPKTWIISGNVGSQEIKLPDKQHNTLSAGESKKVQGSKGNTYTVTYKLDGSWDCTCPAFKWQKGKGDCKHIKGVKSGQI